MEKVASIKNTNNRDFEINDVVYFRDVYQKSVTMKESIIRSKPKELPGILISMMNSTKKRKITEPEIIVNVHY